MTKFTSIIAPLIKNYIAYRVASNQWTKSYETNIISFDKFCAKKYPEARCLSQEMVNEWCKQRPSEINNSFSSRISVVISFLKYLQRRNDFGLIPPERPRSIHSGYIPHIFTEEELKNFFYECDNLIEGSTLRQRIDKITIPVIFRLLYSSGIRTIEARLLRCEDVNLKEGVLNIRHSKGGDQHFVILHDSMTELMKLYEVAITKIFPHRTYFFPDLHGRYHSRRWLAERFKKLWNNKNDSYATPYELRHHYAISNINRWTGKGIEFHSKLFYLSKSMGHRSLKSTTYYFHLTPILADIIKNKTNNSFESIIPNIVNYEK